MLLNAQIPVTDSNYVSLKEFIKPMVEENWRLISTDHALQTFMVGAFSLLLGILTYCSFTGGFGQAELCYNLASTMLSGDLSCFSEDTGFGPLALLLLIPPKLFSPDVSTYNLLFSVYGFAFYMLGGHFMLKSCRETGFSQNAAYVLLYITFLCAFTGITLSTGPMSVAFVIIALWFYQIKKYPVMFLALAASTLIDPWAVIFAAIFLTRILCRKESFEPLPGFGIYLLLVGTVALLSGSPKYFGYDASVLLLFAATIVLCSALALFMKNKTEGMKIPAMLGCMGLIILILMTTGITIQNYIWIMMLFPMTRMLDHAVIDERIGNAMIVIFSILALLSFHIIPEYEPLPIFVNVALAGIGIFLVVETAWSWKEDF